MVGNLVSDVERFARWVYPGLLLIVLLHLGRDGGLIKSLNLDGQAGVVVVFALTVGAIVSSNIIYSLYRYGFHPILQRAFFIFGKSARTAGIGNWL